MGRGLISNPSPLLCLTGNNSRHVLCSLLEFLNGAQYQVPTVATRLASFHNFLPRLVHFPTPIPEFPKITFHTSHLLDAWFLVLGLASRGAQATPTEKMVIPTMEVFLSELIRLIYQIVKGNIHDESEYAEWQSEEERELEM